MNHFLQTGLLWITVGGLCVSVTEGAQKTSKPPKEKPAAKAPANDRASARPAPPPKKYKGDSTNDSIFTQQQTADSFDARLSRGATTQKSPTAPALPESEKLAAIDARIKAEDSRHVAALDALSTALDEARKTGNSKQIKNAEKAVDKEDAAYRRTKASLEQQRQTLLRKASTSTPPPGAASQKPVKK